MSADAILLDAMAAARRRLQDVREDYPDEAAICGRLERIGRSLREAEESYFRATHAQAQEYEQALRRSEAFRPRVASDHERSGE